MIINFNLIVVIRFWRFFLASFYSLCAINIGGVVGFSRAFSCYFVIMSRIKYFILLYESVIGLESMARIEATQKQNIRSLTWSGGIMHTFFSKNEIIHESKNTMAHKAQKLSSSQNKTQFYRESDKKNPFKNVIVLSKWFRPQSNWPSTICASLDFVFCLAWRDTQNLVIMQNLS